MVKARLADVARKAGVTAATVSLVVSGNERISPATKQKVLKAVKELNYRPNSAARSLAAGKTNIIGVTAISFQAWYEMTLMKGMENRIYDTNYTLQQYPSGGYKEREKNILLDCIYAQKADTLIGMSYRPGPAGMKEIKKTSYPFVSLGEKIKGIPSVYFDDFKGGYLAGRHFVKTGKRKPAIIIQKQVKGFETSDMAGRLRGFAEALKEGGIKKFEIYGIKDVYYRDGMEACLKIMKKKPDSVFCAAGDTAAIGFMKQAALLGIRMPREAAVIGYDDIEMAEAVTPELTTIRQPVMRAGEAALETAVKMINKEDVSDTVFEPELIARNSA